LITLIILGEENMSGLKLRRKNINVPSHAWPQAIEFISDLQSILFFLRYILKIIVPSKSQRRSLTLGFFLWKFWMQFILHVSNTQLYQISLTRIR
jgi:hypothetical protein